MSDTIPEPDPFPWLPLSTVLSWLKLTEESPKEDQAELCRLGACSWVEDQRRDLFVTLEDVTTFEPTGRIRSAALLATARLFARLDSPNGVVSFDELGAASILSKDPDVMRYLGHTRRPRTG